MKNIIADAGSFGFGDKWKFMHKRFYGLITKTITPYIRETSGGTYRVRGGWINNIGLANPGLQYYIDEIYKRNYNTKQIVSIHADTVDEYVCMANDLDVLDLYAIELNLSCPNVPNTITSPKDIENLLSDIGNHTGHRIVIKISPYQNYVGIAKSARELYAIHIANTQPVMFIQDGIFAVRGGFSGRHLRYAGLKATYDLSLIADVPIISGGGVYTKGDVKDYVRAGASYVSVCSSIIYNPLRAWWLTM